MSKKEEEQGIQTLKLLCCVLLSGAMALALSVLLLFLCALLVSNGILSGNRMTQYAVAVCVISGFTGGVAAVAKCKCKTLLVGAGTGAVLFLLLLLVGILVFPGVSIENHGMDHLCASVLGGVLAGLLGGKSNKRRRR